MEIQLSEVERNILKPYYLESERLKAHVNQRASIAFVTICQMHRLDPAKCSASTEGATPEIVEGFMLQVPDKIIVAEDR